MPRKGKPIGRPPKAVGDRAVQSGYVFYPKELRQIAKRAKDKGFLLPTDYLRSLVIRDGVADGLALTTISAPRRRENRSENPGQSLALHTLHPQQFLGA